MSALQIEEQTQQQVSVYVQTVAENVESVLLAAILELKVDL